MILETLMHDDKHTLTMYYVDSCGGVGNLLYLLNTEVVCIFFSGSSPTPAKEPVTTVTANSTATSGAHLQTSDAIAAVAQLFQSSQGQQVCLLWFVHVFC